jgi:hypothetical protein
MMMRLALDFFLACLVACTHPAPPTAQPVSAWKQGEEVTVRGQIATEINAHMVQTVSGKTSGYFDVEGERGQIVVYWKEPPACPHGIEITGHVLEARGSPRPPGSRPSKVDDSYAEKHIDVDRARCCNVRSAP